MSVQMEWAASGRPCPGEQVSGDLAWADELDDGALLVVLDGLGHGPEAHAVAVKAKGELERRASNDPVQVLDALHRGLVGGRGAAVAVVRIHRLDGRMAFAAVGNVQLRQLSPNTRTYTGVGGVVGQRMRTPRVQQVPLAPGDVYLLHTDGVGVFKVQDYPQVLVHSARAVARTVVRRFASPYDDATGLALRVLQ